MSNKSINERISNHNCVNPVLRWESGRGAQTIHVESKLIEPDENIDCERDYSDPFGIWGDNGNPNMLDEPITDDEWRQLLKTVEIS